jgi:hypothetical protein
MHFSLLLVQGVHQRALAKKKDFPKGVSVRYRVNVGPMLCRDMRIFVFIVVGEHSKFLLASLDFTINISLLFVLGN